MVSSHPDDSLRDRLRRELWGMFGQAIPEQWFVNPWRAATVLKKTMAPSSASDNADWLCLAASKAAAVLSRNVCITSWTVACFMDLMGMLPTANTAGRAASAKMKHWVSQRVCHQIWREPIRLLWPLHHPQWHHIWSRYTPWQAIKKWKHYRLRRSGRNETESS